MDRRNCLLLVLILSVTFLKAAAQEVPQLIFYQGTLTDASGKPIDHKQSMKFSIWNDQAGGTKLWEESHHAVTVRNGLFSVILGSQSPICVDIFSEKTRYLETIIESETLTPRQQIVSVPYAHASASVSGATNIIPADGNAGIGLKSPKSKLDVNGSFCLSNTSGLPDQTNYNLFMAGNYQNGIDIGKIYVGDNSGWKFHFASRKGGTDSDLMTIKDNGNVGINITNPTSKLQVGGMIHSTTGGFKFPDGSVQTTASIGGGGGDFVELLPDQGHYYIVAAGIVRGDGTSSHPIYNDLRASNGSTPGTVIISFKDYQIPSDSHFYIVKVLVFDNTNVGMATTSVSAFSSKGIILKVYNGAGPVQDVSSLDFMIEISEFRK
jgi:hypothetical protein